MTSSGIIKSQVEKPNERIRAIRSNATMARDRSVSSEQSAREQLVMAPTTNGESIFDSFGGDQIQELSGNARITRGAFGEIHLALRRFENDQLGLVAVKKLSQPTVAVEWGQSSSKGKTSREVFYEVRSLRLLSSHPHIANLVALYPTRGALERGETLSLALEYCPVDLHLSVEWRRCSFLPLLSFDTIRTICRDIFCALQHCHSNNIVHRDVKPGNLLVSSTGMIQLCDFGLATCTSGAIDLPTSIPKAVPQSSSSDLTKTRGMCTLHYRPPEVLLGGRSDHQSVDVYSAGCVLAELLSGGRPLFAGRNDIDQLVAIFATLGTPSDANWPAAKALPDYGKLEFGKTEPRSLKELIPRAVESDGLLDLLHATISLDPEKRLSSDAGFSHAWLADGTGASCRSKLVGDLIPPALDEPLLLVSPSGETTVAAKQVLASAATRRQFLSKLVDSHTFQDDA